MSNKGIVSGIAKRQRDALPEQNFKESVEPPKELDWDRLAERVTEKWGKESAFKRPRPEVPCQNCGYCPTCGRNNKPWRPWDKPIWIEPWAIGNNYNGISPRF